MQVNYHPGWHATVSGASVPVRSDGIGLIVIEPNCSGECDVRLEYDGGLEARLTRAGSTVLLLALLVALIRGRHRGKSR